MSHTEAPPLSDDSHAWLPAGVYAEVLAASRAVMQGRRGFEDLCRLIAERTHEHLPVGGAALLALDEIGMQLTPRAAAGRLEPLLAATRPTDVPNTQGPPDAAPVDPALPLTDSALREAVTEQRTVRVDAGTDVPGEVIASSTGPATGSPPMPSPVSRISPTSADRAWFGEALQGGGLLALPLWCHDHVGGLLVVALPPEGDRSVGGQPDVPAFERITAMADLAGVTLSNAKLREAVQASERRYDIVAEHSSDLISIHDPRGRCVYVSPAARSFLHADPEDVIGRSGYEFIHPDDIPMVRAVHERVLSGEHPDHVSFRMCPVDGGAPLWVETSLRLVQDPATHDVQRLVCITRDVSEQVRARERLRQNRQELENIVNDQVEMIVRTDATGIIRFCNTAFADLLGRTPEGLVGWDVYQFMPDDQRERVHQRFAAATPARPVWLNEHAMQHADGRRVWVRWTNRALFDERGRLVGKQGVGIDITERREAEEALKASERRQRAIAERLNMLLHELDHRVKNNLAELHSLVMLYRDSKADVGAFAEAIAGKLNAMNTVHDLIASGGWRPLDLRDVVEALRGHFAELCGSLNLTVTGESMVIPPRQASALAMILHELLSNSQKHGALCVPDGAVTLRWHQPQSEVNEHGDQSDPSERSASDSDDSVGVMSGRRLMLTWRESGGPTHSTTKTGQGLELIRGLVEFDLAGEARFDLTPGAFHAELCCMLAGDEGSA